MPNHLSTLGIIHTVISVLAILVAFFALYREGKINPASMPGKLYILLTIITCVTGFPIMKTGHPTAGHYLGIMILLLLPIGIYAKSLRVFGKLAGFVQVIIMSATLFFSFIPAIVETLTRLPLSHPIADGPNSPVIQMCLLILVVVYIVGVSYQIIKLRAKRKSVGESNNRAQLS